MLLIGCCTPLRTLPTARAAMPGPVAQVEGPGVVLGSGAFSTVVRARHKQSGREVAIKLIERGPRVR